MDALKESFNSAEGLSRGFTIEKNVPMPEVKRGRRPRYPFADMLVGDSFFVPGDTRATQGARAAAHSHTRRTGKAFDARTVEGGLRIWCVEPEKKAAA